MWRPNNRLLNKSRQKHESLKKSRRKFKNSLKEMKIETKLYLWDAAKVILGEKFIMNQAYLKKQFQKFQINSLCLQLKELEKVEQPSPKFVEGRG